MKKIILKSKREASILRNHPWVFSGAVKLAQGAPTDGDIVEVYSNQGNYLGTGHYQNGSILVRIISFEQKEIDQYFWNEVIQKAYDYRKAIGILDLKETNCYRLIHAEGDALPGLIIDIYHNTAVVQCHTLGMYKALDQIVEALKVVYGTTLKNIYNKSKASLAGNASITINNGYLLQEEETNIVNEYGHRFKVDWVEGQKTGFFLDQRENRRFLQNFVKDKVVLNSFCYTGGFSVYALQAGASAVHSVDISASAMDLTAQNVALNGLSERHQTYTSDVLKFLKESDDLYDVMIVDPPAFAKSLKKRHNAVQGYKRLNAQAMKKIKKGGILFTFSCSQVISRQLFQDTIVAAALEAGRKAKIMHHLSQPPDHPVNLFHPEGSYLKGLVLYIK